MFVVASYRASSHSNFMPHYDNAQKDLDSLLRTAKIRFN